MPVGGGGGCVRRPPYHGRLPRFLPPSFLGSSKAGSLGGGGSGGGGRGAVGGGRDRPRYRRTLGI